MMFFVTEKRLQAILDRDRVGQRTMWEQERMQAIFRDARRLDEIARQEAKRSLFLAALRPQQTPPDPNARLAAKKAATKAARPARKPREKK